MQDRLCVYQRSFPRYQRMSTAFFETLNSHPDPINVLDHECFHIQVVDSLVASPDRPYIRNLSFHKIHTEEISGQTCHARLDATLTLLGPWLAEGSCGQCAGVYHICRSQSSWILYVSSALYHIVATSDAVDRWTTHWV